ncbi:MAG TPA: MotA/TolQ/ExbB proton channel family protein [Chitinivibrionales bacterium]
MVNYPVELFCSLFREGGWVLYPIFAVSMIAWYTGFNKMFQLKKIANARRHFFFVFENETGVLLPKQKHHYEPFDMLLKEILTIVEISPQRVTNLFREFLVATVPDLQQGLSTMSACVSIAPLLGLLGTISGMNRMFSVITDVGLGSPSLMAGGISVALESALTGLTVAVASMFFHNYLFNKKEKCVQGLIKDGEKLVTWAQLKYASDFKGGAGHV